MEQLVFTAVGDKKVATITLTGDFALHLEVAAGVLASVALKISTVSGAPKTTKIFEYFSGSYDEDFKGIVYPKYAEIEVSTDVSGAVTFVS